jgi:hypothetical protein
MAPASFCIQNEQFLPGSQVDSGLHHKRLLIEAVSCNLIFKEYL